MKQIYVIISNPLLQLFYHSPPPPEMEWGREGATSPYVSPLPSSGLFSLKRGINPPEHPYTHKIFFWNFPENPKTQKKW